MREKTLRVVVTFATTSDAMAMEEASLEHGIPGRIIPVPSEIDAGCGVAWAVEAANRSILEAGLSDHELAYEGIYEVMMY